jgi:N-carbamoyl-L-amino-acid hydrolase
MVPGTAEGDGVRIHAGRLHSRLQDLSRIGSTPEGGVTRLALSIEDRQARKQVVAWALARGFECRRDLAGNLFVVRAGHDREALPVMTGSHLDTQRNGGNLDGVYGVVAGLEVLESLEDEGASTSSDLVLAIWNNEEGVRFAPVTMGSSLWAGKLRLADLATQIGSDGVSLETAIAEDEEEVSGLGAAAFASPFRAYLELHIEQGPVLEAANLPIGIVTGIQGVRQFLFKVSGEAAHAGTTPMVTRKDAFLGALELHSRLRALAIVDDPEVRFTVGRMSMNPGAPNTIPSEVAFTVDFRCPDATKLRERGAAMLNAADRLWAGCSMTVSNLIHSEPVSFADFIMESVRGAARAEGLPFLDLPSGATHDALNAASIGPTGMIFVPSRGGVSHNPKEWTDPEQLAWGCQVLANALRDLDYERGSDGNRSPTA